MKTSIVLIFLFLFSCQTKKGQKENTDISNFKQTDKSINKNEHLFTLNEINSENLVKIIPPKNSDFELPDSTAKTEPYKNEDFNADGKNDIMVYLGACGTGGCIYGIFLNQNQNYYKLVFMDYLKGAEFEVENNGFISVKSYEEIEPYNPSKLSVTKFKFNETKYKYELDTTYVYLDR
ncbi:hypothetical protein [Gaetbulibacter jejuensis]|uniref:Lipoprotein n=1 Tax=Gaetbulibacter jejuensis TaxID=584607 RepID=A0ABN1JEK0_9FLAO